MTPVCLLELVGVSLRFQFLPRFLERNFNFRAELRSIHSRGNILPMLLSRGVLKKDWAAPGKNYLKPLH